MVRRRGAPSPQYRTAESYAREGLITEEFLDAVDREMAQRLARAPEMTPERSALLRARGATRGPLHDASVFASRRECEALRVTVTSEVWASLERRRLVTPKHAITKKGAAMLADEGT